MRTTIRLNEELARRAKEYAARSGRTFAEVVEEAVAELLGREGRERPRDKVILPTCGDPSRKITWEELQAAIGQAQYEDDLRGLGLGPTE